MTNPLNVTIIGCSMDDNTSCMNQGKYDSFRGKCLGGCELEVWGVICKDGVWVLPLTKRHYILLHNTHFGSFAKIVMIKNISLIQCLCLTVETWDSIFHLMFWAFSTLNKIASYNNVDRATAAKHGVHFYFLVLVLMGQIVHLPQHFEFWILSYYAI